jgi:cytochrome bd-type quinol oxidase subunit 1
MVAISLIAFFILYAALGVVDFILMRKYARKELASPAPEETPMPAPAMTY